MTTKRLRVELRIAAPEIRFRPVTIADIDPTGTILSVSPQDLLADRGPVNNFAVAAMPTAWESVVGDLNITEFYTADYDTVNDVILGGAQDTGNAIQSATGASQWSSIVAGNLVRGGDGAFVEIGDDRYYYSTQNLGEFSVARPVARLTGNPTLTFTHDEDEDSDFRGFIDRSVGTWASDGFVFALEYFTVTGTRHNDGVYRVNNVSDTPDGNAGARLEVFRTDPPMLTEEIAGGDVIIQGYEASAPDLRINGTARANLVNQTVTFERASLTGSPDLTWTASPARKPKQRSSAPRETGCRTGLWQVR